MQEEWQADEEENKSFALRGSLLRLVRRPFVVLILLCVWTVLAFLSQVFVNSGLFLDIHDLELDGALGGLAFSFNALPLTLVYLYALRAPSRHVEVFWLGMIQQTAMFAAALYHWAIGTFSLESVLAPIAVSAALAVLSFLQIFEPRRDRPDGMASQS